MCQTLVLINLKPGVVLERKARAKTGRPKTFLEGTYLPDVAQINLDAVYISSHELQVNSFADEIQTLRNNEIKGVMSQNVQAKLSSWPLAPPRDGLKSRSGTEA